MQQVKDILSKANNRYRYRPATKVSGGDFGLELGKIPKSLKVSIDKLY